MKTDRLSSSATRLALLNILFATGTLVGCGGGGDSTPAAPTSVNTPPAVVAAPPPAAASPATVCAKTSAKIGKTVTFSTKAHGVSGKAQVTDNCTIVVTGFNYDGGGLPDVFFYTGKAGNYAAGSAIGSNLFGTKVTNGTITITVKDGDLESTDGLSIWCVRAGVSFGDGLFI
jgi:Electron transfer DM13